MRRLIVFAGLSFGLCLIALSGFGPRLHAQNFGLGALQTERPTPAPMIQFQDGAGRAVVLSDFKGRYVLLNLWATWCSPCAEEMPSLNGLPNHFPAGKLMIIPLSEDHDGETVTKSFYRRHGLDRLQAYSDPSGQSLPLLHARGLPTTVLIDPAGMEIARFEGAVDWTAAPTLAYLSSVIK